MYSFVTVDKNQVVTRLVQTTNMWRDGVKQTTVYYVGASGYVEFDGSAHSMSSDWLSDCIGRWTRDGGSIVAAWSGE